MSKLFKNHLRVNCFILLFFSGFIFLNKKYFSATPRFFNETYYAIPEYFELSENYSEGFGPLIIGKEGDRKIYSFLDYDPGFPILISFLGYLGVEFHSTNDLKLINIVLLWFSFFLFSLIFIKKEPLVFLITQALIIHFFFNLGGKLVYDWSDFHGTVPVLAIFTFILIEFFSKKDSYPKIFTFSILGGVLGMFRGFFTHVFVFLICLSFRKILSLNKPYQVAASVFALLICFNFSNIVQHGVYYHVMTKYPDLPFGVPKLAHGDYNLYNGPPPYKHGVWHNTYIGLGVFENKYGIDYQDIFGIEHALRFDPNVQTYSPKYFSILKKLYVNYLMEHPGEYIKNHFLKGLMSFFRLIIYVFKPLFPIFFISLLVFYLRRKNHWNMNFMKQKIFHIEPSHFVPFFLFFTIPVITIYYHDHAILTYSYLLAIRIISEMWEQNPI